MAVIYFDKKPVKVTSLEGWLPDLSRWQRVAVDTETSGLYVDGDYKDAPPARISAVSIAWYCGGESITKLSNQVCGDFRTHRHSLAMPFDQGFIGGKPGKWSDDINGYETLPHTKACNERNAQALEWSDGFALDQCICAPWNLSIAEYYRLIAWLPERPLVMHHKKFDCHMFRAGLRLAPNTGIDLMEFVEADTMLRQGIIEPLKTSSLKPTCARMWPEEHSAREADEVKAALKKNGTGLTWRYDLLAWDVLGPYAGEDADMTIHLDSHILESIDAGEIETVELDVIDQEERLSELLYKMENRGIGLDKEGMRAAAEHMECEVARVAELLPFKPANSNAAKAWFYDTLQLIPIKTTDVCRKCSLNLATGKSRRKNIDPNCKHERSPSLDTEVAARLAREKVQGAVEWEYLAKLNSALSKWYRAWPHLCGSDGRIRTVFRQGRIESDRPGQTAGGAISGRLSTERVQTQGVPDNYKIPKGVTPIKQLFRARPGCEVHEFDLSNAEVRVAAWLLQSPTLRDACMSSNVHSANCVLMFGDMLLETCPSRPTKPLLTAEEKIQFLENEHPEWGKYRKIAKQTVLSLFFSAGIRTMKAQIEQVTNMDFRESEVRKFKELTMRVVPELTRVSKAMERKAMPRKMGGSGYIRLVNGRRRWFGWAERTYKAFNSGTQGGVAEVTKEWMLLIEEMYPGMLINQVHDSLWLEIPIDRFEEVSAGVKASGKELFERRFSTSELFVPFEVDSKRLA